MVKKRLFKSGYTLIEMLVVVGIFGIIAVVGSMTFLYLLKGATKTKTVSVVKQNGEYAMGVMERTIRNAVGFEEIIKGEEGLYSSITLHNPDGVPPTVFSCGDSDGDGYNDIASNGANLLGGEVEVEDAGCLIFNVRRDEFGIEPDVVIIDFTLNRVGGTRPEEQASVHFRTTVVLRNLLEE